MKVGTGLAVTVLTWFDLGWSAVFRSIVLVAALALQAAYGADVWFTAPHPISKPVSDEIVRGDRM